MSDVEAVIAAIARKGAEKSADRHADEHPGIKVRWITRPIGA